MAVSISKCNKVKLVGPASLKVKSTFRKEYFNNALMHHHAGQRFTVAPQTVLAARLGSDDGSGLLQLVLDPGAAAQPVELTGVPSVEMFHVPVSVVATVEVYQLHHFVDG